MIGKRIRTIREKKDLTQREFAGLVGVSPNYVSEIESGKSQPSNPILYVIEDRLGINPEWLVEGKGEMWAAPKIPHGSDIGEAYGDFVFIEQKTEKIITGEGQEPQPPIIEMRVAFRRDWIKRKGDPTKMSLIKIDGDSMEPTLRRGDLILVDHDRNYIDPNGGIYAIAMGNKIVAKRLELNLATQKIRVISDNSTYSPLEIEPDQLHINGKVIWFAREMER